MLVLHLFAAQATCNEIDDELCVHESLCRMLHVLGLVVEDKVVYDVMSVGYMPCIWGCCMVCCMLCLAQTRTNVLMNHGGFWACGKLPWKWSDVFFFLHRFDVWRMVNFFFSMDGMFGRAGVYFNTNRIPC